MATATVDKVEKATCECAECTGIRRAVDDVYRQAEHVAHKARVLKTVAADAVEGYVVESAHRIKQDPFKAVGIAFAVGVPVGAFLGWVFSNSGNRRAL